MSDGQGKSDDLIAELAKLMASSANGAEAEQKPAPKLVSGPDAPQPVVPTIRIPGMDAASAAQRPPAAPAPGPAAPVAASAPAPIAPGVLRIPGMDQPVPVAPRITAPAVEPVRSVPVAAEARPESAEARGLPKFVPVRPANSASEAPAVGGEAPAVEPAVRSAAELAPAAPRQVAPPVEMSGPVPRSEPAAPAKVESTVQRAEPEVVFPRQPEPAAKPAAEDFDFDFGFGNNAPPSVTASEKRQAAAAPAPVTPGAVEPTSDLAGGDPIAELIAAELEGRSGAPSPRAEPVMPAPVQGPQLPPAPARPQPQQVARPVNLAPAQQQRPMGAQPPVRPPAAPVPVAAHPAQAAMQSQPKPVEARVTAPVFGTPGRPQTAPSVDRDPMEEIESLIGEAVSVELSAPEKPVRPEPAAAARPLPPPSVPPLTTGLAPRRATIKDNSVEVPSAEAAILAAAAASGAEVGRIAPTFATEPSPYKRPKAKRERNGLLQGGVRQYIGMAVAGTLLLAAGFGLYWVVGMGHGPATEVPVLSADTTPVKEPPPAVPTPPATQGSVVFGELDGSTAKASADEQLVSRDNSTDTSVADVAKPVGESTDTAAPAATGETELANRKVRTVTVRPDGTIVSGDDAVAGAEELPVDRPNVPSIPGADVQPSDLLAALPTSDAASTTAPASAGAANDAIGALAAGGDAALAPDATANTLPGSGATINPAVVAPVPMARPTDRSTLGGGANQRVASTPPPVDLIPTQAAPAAPATQQAAAPQPASPSAPQASGPYVQLSSQPTQADAQASLRATQSRLSSLLGGRSLTVRQVDLGAKGVWYRVVLPMESFQEATQTCASLKANGTDCVPING